MRHALFWVIEITAMNRETKLHILKEWGHPLLTRKKMGQGRYFNWVLGYRETRVVCVGSTQFRKGGQGRPF